MATFRPAVKTDDGYIQKIIKYIPAEIIAGYTALVGYLNIDSTTSIPTYKTYYLILLVALFVITPVWTYYAVYDDASTQANKTTRAIFQATIAAIAFLIWVYAVGNPLLKALLCGCTTIICKDCPQYSPVLGSIILVLFTILTPLLDRIILGKKS
jgi:hypothetical protein